MKKITAMAVMLLMAVGAFAQEGRNIYNKYSDAEGVSAVYISPTMFKLIGQIPDLDVETSSGEKMNISPLVRSFSGFYMLDLSDSPRAAELVSDVDAMVRKGRYEMLMEVKDDGDNIHIYTVGDEKTIKSFVFICRSYDEVQFICLEGLMNRSDLENLIANM